MASTIRTITLLVQELDNLTLPFKFLEPFPETRSEPSQWVRYAGEVMIEDDIYYLHLCILASSALPTWFEKCYSSSNGIVAIPNLTSPDYLFIWNDERRDFDQTLLVCDDPNQRLIGCQNDLGGDWTEKMEQILSKWDAICHVSPSYKYNLWSLIFPWWTSYLARKNSGTRLIGNFEAKFYHFTVPQNVIGRTELDLLRDYVTERDWSGPFQLSFSCDVQLHEIQYVRKGFSLLIRVNKRKVRKSQYQESEGKLVLTNPLSILQRHELTIEFRKRNLEQEVLQRLKIWVSLEV